MICKMITNTDSRKVFFVLFMLVLIMLGCSGKNHKQDDTGICTVEDDQNSGFLSIFNGENLAEWDGDPRFWRVEYNKIIGETTAGNPAKENTFLIWEGGEPGNFELTFNFRFVNVGDDRFYGNSGIQFRSERFTDPERPNQNWKVRGYQADFAVEEWVTGLLYDEKGRGILAQPGQKVLLKDDQEKRVEQFAGEDILDQTNLPGQWNSYHIYANGDTLRASVNGQKMHEVIDLTSEAERKGVLAFQIHSGPPMRVEICNVRLKKIE